MTTTTENDARLATLVAKIEAHQKATRMSDVQFVARHIRHLRSTRTWRDRLCAGKFDEIGRREVVVRRLETLLAEIEGREAAIEALHERLPITAYALGAAGLLAGQRNDRRVCVLIGPTGVGKTSACRAICRRAGRGATLVLAHPGWRENMRKIAGGLADATGATVHSSAADTLDSVIEALSTDARTICIDDVHEAGVTGLKVVKTLVDQTMCRFVLTTYPQRWAALVNASTAAMCEAQQLMGRTLKPVRLDWIEGVRVADVEAFLREAGVGGTPADLRHAAGTLAPLLRRHGNLRPLIDALELARDNTEDEGAELTPDVVATAVSQLCPEGRGA